MKMESDTISIIIAALNEEENLLPTFKVVKGAIDGRFKDYEIIIFNDGSTDNTGKVAEDIAKTDTKTRVIHHRQSMNLGYVYKSGIKLAKMQYVIVVTGDNDVSSKSLEDTFDLRHKADIVIPYHLNEHIRPPLRRLLSKYFIFFMNLLFRLNLRYYNGLVLHKTEIINSINIKTNSFVYQAEALVKLLRKGHTFVEVGIYLTDRQKGSSKAFRLKNIVTSLKAVFDLAMEELI